MTKADRLLRQAFDRHQAGALNDAEALYRQVLAIRPADHDALHLLGVIKGALGAPDEGIALIRQSVALNPGFAAAHFNLGGLLLARHQPEEALASLLTSLEQRPDHAGALAAAGRASLALGRPEAACFYLGKAAELAPADAVIHSDLGTARYALGHLDEALAAYEAALALNPAYADAQVNRGCVLLARLAYDEAAAAFQAALAIQPAHRGAALNLSLTRQAQGRPAEAVAVLDAMLTLGPADIDARMRRAAMLGELRRHADAIADYSAVLAIQPDNVAALAGRGEAHWSLLQPEAAAADLDRALALDPDWVPALIGRGNLLQDRSDFAGAADCYQRALALQPDRLAAVTNLGAALQALQLHDRALATYQRALALRPDDPENLMSLGICHLRMGHWEEGWSGFEARWRLPLWSRALQDFTAPVWDGTQDLAGKRILLVGEQGIGDNIQFGRFAGLVAARGGHVILGVEQPLRRLMRDLAPEIAVAEDQPVYDYYCLLMSLPHVLRLRGGDLAVDGPYLRADPAEAAAWRDRLAALPGMKVGLAWAGDPRPHDPMASRIDRRRSVALARLAPILAVPGMTFVSLQKGHESGQAKDWPVVDWTAELHDYADTAALMTALDLVISVDTSVVHAAGALGCPVWVLNRFDRCWRWMWDRTDSPWYPTMRLFTQPSPGDWDGLATQVAAALAECLTQNAPGTAIKC